MYMTEAPQLSLPQCEGPGGVTAGDKTNTSYPNTVAATAFLVVWGQYVEIWTFMNQEVVVMCHVSDTKPCSSKNTIATV